MQDLPKEFGNTLTRARDSLDREQLLRAFPKLKACPNSHFLALRRYLARRPEKFFDTRSFQFFLEWLERLHQNQHSKLRAYLRDQGGEIDRALSFLREINREQWHDSIVADGADLARFIDKHIHPSYLRLVEGVLTPLLRVISYFSRLNRNKGTEGLDVWSVVQEIRQQTAFPTSDVYHHTVRNSIAHGGITFLSDSIRYRDKRGNEETLQNSFVVRLLDDTLDVCNGLAVALRIFLSLSRSAYTPLKSILQEELEEETSNPWWSIEACLDSQLGPRSQLIIYAKTNSRHYSKVLWSTLQSGVLAEYFSPGYDRYFVSIHSNLATPGWAAFNGGKLRRLRQAKNQDLAAYRSVIEDNLVFYNPRPKLPTLLGRIDTLRHSLLLHAPIFVKKFKENLGRPEITTRIARIHRNGWRSVLNAKVLLVNPGKQSSMDAIRTHKRRIVSSALKAARKQAGLDAVSLLPLGYATVSIFNKDYRLRRLHSFGLGEDLICTLRLQRIRRIRSPDLIASTIENQGKWRIAWNRAWLENGQDKEPGDD